MKPIIQLSFVSNNNGKEFYTNISETIGDMQRKGLEVEVQYGSNISESTTMFSALILGRGDGVLHG